MTADLELGVLAEEAGVMVNEVRHLGVIEEDDEQEHLFQCVLSECLVIS